MHLVGRDGDAIRLAIEGYQFPDSEKAWQRFSWHMIEGEATKGDETWSFRYPALTCDESARIAPWLLSLLRRGETKGVQDRDVLCFTEPNLLIQLVERSDVDVTIAVELDVEFQHPRKRVARTRTGDPTVLIIRLDREAIEAAAEEWDANLRRYPDGLV